MGGVRHLILQILTVGNPAAIFYYLSSPRHIVFNPRPPEALARIGYNPRHLVLLQRLPQAQQVYR